MLMKTNSRLSGDRDCLVFDYVAIKNHGVSSTTLLKNRAEKHGTGE